MLDATAATVTTAFFTIFAKNKIMTKKRKSRKKPSANNSMLMLIAIVAILAIVSVVVAYFVLDNDNNETIETITEIIQTDDNSLRTEEQKTIKTPIEGTWVSNYDGAMLTISGTTFSLELPSVDASGNVKGSIAVENTIVTFSNTTGTKTCIGKEGHYNYSFEDDELMLNKIKDPCDRRSERMTESWFRL